MGCEHRGRKSFFAGFRKLADHWQRRPWSLAEESDQPFDILCSCSQEELLTNKLYSPQAQSTKSDLILEFRKQCFHFLSLSLCCNEGRSVDQVASPLSRR